MERGENASLAGIRDVFLGRPDGSITRYRERVLKQGSNLRIEYAPGSQFAGQIIVDDGVTRRHYNPDTKEIKIRPAMGDPLRSLMQGPPPKPARRPRGPISFTAEGFAKVAGIRAAAYRIEGQEKKTLARFWIDLGSGVVLKRHIMGLDGKVVAGFEFLSLRLDPDIPRTAFQIRIPGVRVISLEDQLSQGAQDLGFKPMKVSEASGWRLVGVRKIDTEKMKFLSQTYRKDKGRVTLFMVKGRLDPVRLRELGRGRVASYSWVRDGVSFALIGSLSDDELRQLASQVGPPRP
jgi:outer membrane lipoprotein-sorting protein